MRLRPLTWLREHAEDIYLMFMLPPTDFRIQQLHLAAKRLVPQNHVVEVWGAASARWFRVVDATASEVLIDARGSHAFVGAIHGVVAMADAARGEREEES